jgi:hypothetical protein
MRVVAIIAGLISAFFVFYTARLLVVTHGLQQTRAGGQGAYIGAVVFPILALGAGLLSVRLWKRGAAPRTAAD